MLARTIVLMGILVTSATAVYAGPREDCVNLRGDAAIAACAQALRANLREITREDVRAADAARAIVPPKRALAIDPSQAGVRGALKRFGVEE